MCEEAKPGPGKLVRFRLRQCVLIINPRRAYAARVYTVLESVCVCLRVSVKSHLTYGASIRRENAGTYSAGNEGQKICVVFSETTTLLRYGVKRE